MKHLIVANWKMNPASTFDAVKLAREEDIKDVVIAPPFVHISSIHKILKKGVLCAQDIDPVDEVSGPFTGAHSPSLMKKFGVRYTIIGHSERRMHFGESDEIIAKKIRAALDAGIVPILCIGEASETRAAGYMNSRDFVLRQLERDLSLIKGGVGKLVIAYEPVWAISTNNSGAIDDPEGAGEMIQSIKAFLSESMKLWAQYKVLVLYGGSVGVNNIGVFMKERSIDGFLVGGASLRPKEFKKIVEIAHT